MNKWPKRILKILGWIVGVLVILVLGLVVYTQLTWARPVNRPVLQMTALKDEQTIARGEYLFKYGNQCWGCHSQGTPDPNAPQSGGKEWNLANIGPGFGIYYSRNITPDRETGIGAWTDGEIVRALREGLSRDGRAFFPLMPGDFYKGLADKDVLAIVSYLRSLPAVKNEVRDAKPSFAAKALFALKVLKPQPVITQPVVSPPAGPTAEYGKYLATNASGCSECHTPRDTNTGKVFFDRAFSGSSFAFGGELEGLAVEAHAPNLTPDKKTGIGAWTEEQFIQAMRNGARTDGTVMITAMPYPYYSFWTDDDLKAVYRYLRTVPALENEVPGMEYLAGITSGSSVSKGEAMFTARCASCHGEKGKGAAPTSAALATVASSLSDADISNFIKNGMPGSRMAGFGKTLTEEQIIDLIAFIRSW